MNRFIFLISVIGILGMIFFSPFAYAGGITLPFGHDVEGVKHLPSLGLVEEGTKGVGLGFFRMLINTVGSALSLVLGSIALIALFVAGYQLVTAQQAASEQIEKQKMNVMYIMIGLVVFALSGDFVYNFLFFEEGGYLLPGAEEEAERLAAATVDRIRGLLNLFLSFSGAGAILMLVIASLYLVINPGDADQIEKQKKVVGYTAVGIIIVGLADTLVNQVFFPRGGFEGVNVPLLELQLQGLSNYVLGFLGIIVFVSMVICGVLMVVYFGNEEVTTKVKTTLKNVVIGALVAFSAYTVVATLLTTFLAAEPGTGL